MPPHLLEKYFEQIDTRWTFRRNYRRNVIFGRHDLVQDAPISRVDLLTCRNTLMYFNSETQGRMLIRFNYALNDGGFLMMGKAEMLFTHSNLFVPYDLKQRIFVKQGTANTRDHLLMLAAGKESENNQTGPPTSRNRFREAAFDHSPVAQIVVDTQSHMVLINTRARTLFNLKLSDLNRPLQDLDFSYRIMELRNAIDQCYAQRRAIDLKPVDWLSADGQVCALEPRVAPLLDTANELLGVNITFADVTRFRGLQDEIEHANQELESAYEELQSTNEELETTNEELQSSNEEFETINEELHSTNEELQTINEELQRRTEDLDHTSTFLNNILTSLNCGVVVVDSDLLVTAWNDHSEELWGLREEEVRGKNFMNLDIGLPVEQLRAPIRNALANSPASAEIVLDAVNRRGRSFRCKVGCTALMGGASASAPETAKGAILLLEDMGLASPEK